MTATIWTTEWDIEDACNPCQLRDPNEYDGEVIEI